MSFTVWVFTHANARHHDNNLFDDTFEDPQLATSTARARVANTNYGNGFAFVVDNALCRMGDRGVVVRFQQKNGRIFKRDVREGYERRVAEGRRKH
jgi:hypothetical protein